jgi:hypothetical protein
MLSSADVLKKYFSSKFVHITLENQYNYLDKHLAQKKIKKIDLQLALDKNTKTINGFVNGPKQAKVPSLGPLSIAMSLGF